MIFVPLWSQPPPSYSLSSLSSSPSLMIPTACRHPSLLLPPVSSPTLSSLSSPPPLLVANVLPAITIADNKLLGISPVDAASVINADSSVSGKKPAKRKRARKFCACIYPGCLAVFPTVYSMKRHLKRHTGERPHVCEWKEDNGKACGRTFAENSTLKRHYRTHTKEKPYICTTCDRAFADRLNLNRHQLRVHNSQDETQSSQTNFSE